MCFRLQGAARGRWLVLGLLFSWIIAHAAPCLAEGAAASQAANPLRTSDLGNQNPELFCPPVHPLRPIPAPAEPQRSPASALQPNVSPLAQRLVQLPPRAEASSADKPKQEVVPVARIVKVIVPPESKPTATSPLKPQPMQPSENRKSAVPLVARASANFNAAQPAATEPAPKPAPAPEQRLAEEPMPEELPASESPSPDKVGHAPVTSAQPQLWLPTESNCRCGVACPPNGCRHEPTWRTRQPIPWQVFAQGEYVGPARLAHVPQYHIRVDDIIRVVYGLTGAPSTRPYELAVGDIIKIESLGSPNLERQVTVQPDGMVTMRLLGQVPAAGRSIESLRKDLETQYQRYVKEPAISITPIKLNSRLEELRAAVDQRYGTGGQGVFVRVTPAGYIQLPSIGSVPAQGLTLDEIKEEIEARYARRFHGIEVTPVLDRRAPRYVFVLGEVRSPGRYELEGPTTAMQAIAMAGSWNVGANLSQIVVFRRDECWRLMATRIGLRCALDGNRPCPNGEIWLRDSDIVLVPKSALLATDDAIELLFTRGLYGVVPINFGVSWTRLTAL